MIENEGDNDGEPAEEKKDNYDHISPYIYLSMLLKEALVATHWGWLVRWKNNIFTSWYSWSTHKFISFMIANKLQYQLNGIKPIIVEVVNDRKMTCSAVYKNFQWKVQGVQFVVDVFVVELTNYDTILGIQWLALLCDVSCTYKDTWMSFN